MPMADSGDLVRRVFSPVDRSVRVHEFPAGGGPSTGLGLVFDVHRSSGGYDHWRAGSWAPKTTIHKNHQRRGRRAVLLASNRLISELLGVAGGGVSAGDLDSP